MFRKQPALRSRSKSNSKLQNEEKNHGPGSSINFFWSKIVFTNEPLWFRIVVIVLLILATVVIIWMLKQWTLPAFLAQKLSSIRIESLLNIFKSKS